MAVDKSDSKMDTRKTNSVNITLQSEDEDILSLEFSPIPSPGHQTSLKVHVKADEHTSTSVTEPEICSASVSEQDKIDLNLESSEIKKASTNEIKNETETSEINSDITKEANLQILEDNSEKSPSKIKLLENGESLEIVENKINITTNETEILQPENLGEVEKPTLNNEGNSKIFCSTPLGSKSTLENLKLSLRSSTSSDFGMVSPLISRGMNDKKPQKRKNLGIIEEVDENCPEVCPEKKVKANNEKPDSISEQEISSALPCFEPPAKSILKKLQTSGLSRNSTIGSTTYHVIDDCGDSDGEDGPKQNQELSETSAADDFEVACKSLTEELMKSTTNIGALEKYYSQIQLENQMDDEKFDEVFQELTSNVELYEKTSLSLKTMDESNLTLPESDKVNNIDIKQESEKSEIKDSHSTDSSLLNTTVIEVNTNTNTTLTNINKSDENDKLDQETKEAETNTKESSSKLIIKVKDEFKEIISESSNEAPASSTEKLSIVYADEKDMTMDEEDVLLEEDTTSKKKPYVFFEFVSNDPKENEDNYNPEWQRLGRLTSDEERYKAVRDRWRSLVPPDPNRDLTCRQWRKNNQKPPLNFSSLNNNHQMHFGDERNQLCTAVFQMKINRTQQELEDYRKTIFIKRNMAFEELALAQDKQQRMLVLRGGNCMEMSNMHKNHIQECCKLKEEYDLELRKVTNITDQKIRILKEARDEVMLFQKFYKGVGTSDDNGYLYMTDTQVKELMETEEMLEQYSQFYC